MGAAPPAGHFDQGQFEQLGGCFCSHRGRHLVQLAHCLVDRRLQVVVEFSRPAESQQQQQQHHHQIHLHPFGPVYTSHFKWFFRFPNTQKHLESVSANSAVLN